MVSSRQVWLLASAGVAFNGVVAEANACSSASVAVLEEEMSLLQDRNHHWWNRATSGSTEVDYVVTKDHVATDAPGIAYRASMDLEDRDPNNALSLWGSVVRGEPIGMDWLKVGSLYLPMRVSGHPVLERETLSDAATLAVTGQEPDAREPEATDTEASEQAAEADATEVEIEGELEEAAEATEEAVTEASESEAIDPEAADVASTEADTREQQIEDAVSELEAREPEVPREAIEEAVRAAAAEDQESSEPEVTEEVATEPEATEEAATEPDAQEEGATEQEATEPEATEEVATEEVATEPEATEEVATEEVATEPEATEESAPAPEAIDEVVPAPEVVEPEATAEVATEPEFVEPEPEPFDGVVVEFGVIFRSLPMLDFQSGTFTASLAFTQRWPSDASSYDAAAVGDGQDPWSPNLVVTNHDIGGVEAISTSTTVNQTSGMVTQVDYLTVRVLQTFQLKSFPFDSQVLSVRVAPASPGGVSMKLVPIDVLGEPTLDPELLQGHGFRLESVNEEQSILQAQDATLTDPARGVVEVAMRRSASAYFSQLFLPSVLLLGVCWSTFFLPLPDAGVATPRTAVTAVAFVAILILVLHAEQMIPARFGRMWLDVFTENVATLVFAAMAFNTLEQHVHSNMKRPTLASSLSRELQMFYPSLSACVLGTCFCVTSGEALTMLSAFCRLVLLAGILGYSGAAYARALSGDEEKPRSPMAFRSPR